MKIIVTKDGSITYHNLKFNETYHSISGAKEESVKKFLEPCIEIIQSKKKINVLDICFGLGYNSAALIDYILNNNLDCNINIIGLEIDEEILNKIKDNRSSGFDNYKIIQGKKSEKIYIEIKLGDARNLIEKLDQKFDIVFLDPFSPKKCPELWTKKFFIDIKKKMNEKGILTTYSCAKIVRENLKSAGFKIKDGPCVGRRGPSTIALNIR